MQFKDLITLLGGVAMFLFGMSLMGDGLKKVAGNKLELILYRLSSTPLKGILLGTMVTAVIQSSSATSVMVVGFVNSAMMRLRQAIAVILGAILGTSVTGWILCLSGMDGGSVVADLLSTETLSALIAITGILIRMISKKKSMQHIGDILMGFAVLMFGMKTMSGAVSGLRDDPAFVHLLLSFSNPVLGILIGLAVTAVLQSASASVGILQALSLSGMIQFREALPIILGIAIGASVPVIISGIGSSLDGRRTAWSYPVIELIRVILFAGVFYGLNAFFRFSFMEQPVNMVSIAMINTLFRLTTILVLAPLIPLIEKIMQLIIPGKPEEETEIADMNRLEERFLVYPTLAVEQTRLAMNRMAEITRRSMVLATDLLLQTYSEKTFTEVQNLEALVDRYEDKIGSYLMRITGQELTETQNKAVSQYLRAITDLERISDHALNIAERAQEIEEKKLEFSDKARKEMENLANAVLEIVAISFESFENEDTDSAYRVEPLEQVIDQLCRKMREKHTVRLQMGKCTIGNGYVFNDLIADFERVSDHCSNIGLVLAELTEDALDVHEKSDQMKQEHPHHFETYYEEFSQKYLGMVNRAE